MADYVWFRTVNFFTPIIQESYVGAEAIFEFTDKALFNAIADPAILAIYDVYNPLRVKFAADYLVWGTLRSGTPGKTLSITQLLDDLSSTHIREWDLDIQSVYNIKTAQYKTLLPHRRTPFQSGKIAERTKSLHILLAAIGTDASLATVKGLITTFVGLLTTAIDKQSGQIKAIDTAITNLDASALAAAEGLLFVYGSLMAKYFKTPITVNNFFDVSLLHNVPQLVFNTLFKKIKAKKLCSRKMDEIAQSLKFTVEGNDPVNAFYTNGIIKTHVAGTPMLVLAGNSISTHNFTDAGYTDTNRFLYIQSTTSSEVNIKTEIMG